MNPSLWLAHILAFHLSVPEPVEFRFREDLPRAVCAQMAPWMLGGEVTKWEVQYSPKCWKDHPQAREVIIAHEACHAAFDHDVAGEWDTLSEVEEERRHRKVRACAEKIVRDHRQGTCILPSPGGGNVKKGTTP